MDLAKLTPIEARNQSICTRYVDGETADSIALDCGLGVMAVRMILKAGNALRGTTKRVKRSAEDKVITTSHLRIGTTLSHYRAFTRGIDRRMAAQELQWSVQRVASVEQGTYNLSLLDLQDLARFMNTTIGELVNDKTPQRQGVLEHEPDTGANLLVLPQRTLTLVHSVDAKQIRDDPRREDHSDHQEAL